MVSCYYPKVTLSVRRTVFEIFNFNNAVTLKTGLGSVRIIENFIFYREPMTSYRRSIVTIALFGVVSETFNVEKYRYFEVPVKANQDH